MKRRLAYVPIIHTSSDMGSLEAQVRSKYLEKIGKPSWTKHVAAIDEMWSEIERLVGGLEVDFRQVKLYQDGLPTCGRELEIVSELARLGSRNHLLLQALVARGAELVGTESPELLMEEYRSLKAALEEGRSAEGEEATRELLRRRDQFIARRIDETLREGETGILFIGLLHRVDEYLPASIEALPLIARLPFKEVGGGQGQ